MSPARYGRQIAVGDHPVGHIQIIERDALSQSEISAIHAYCAVYTRSEVVRAALDRIGWTGTADLRSRQLLEPAAGDGAFLIPAVERLVESARRHGFCTEAQLMKRVVAYEFEARTAIALGARVRRCLIASGLTVSLSNRLAKTWVRCEDFLTSSVSSGFTDIVGNPPYMRWSKLPKGLREAYQTVLPPYAAKGDLCLGFVSKSVDLLASQKGRIAFLCSDRWLKCAYAERARRAIRQRVRIASHVEAHGLPVFAGTRKVMAYAALTVMDTHVEGGGQVSKPNAFAAFLRDVRQPPRPKGRVTACRLLREEGGALVTDAATGELLAAVIERHPKVGDAGISVRCGMALGCAAAFIVEPDSTIEPERLVPFVRSQDIARDGTTTAAKLLANVWSEDGKLIELKNWPRLAAHLARWRKQLSQRACVGGATPWYRTIDHLHSDRSADRIFVAGMARQSRVATAKLGDQPSNALYVLETRQWPTSALFALLRSGFLDLFAAGLAPTFSGASRRFDGNVLRQVRIPLWSSVEPAARRQLEGVDVDRAVARPGLICDVLCLRTASHHNVMSKILAAAWGEDIA